MEIKIIRAKVLLFKAISRFKVFSVCVLGGGGGGAGEDLWWPFLISVKSHAHFQMVDNVIVQCELLLTSIFQFLRPF